MSSPLSEQMRSPSRQIRNGRQTYKTSSKVNVYGRLNAVAAVYGTYSCLVLVVHRMANVVVLFSAWNSLELFLSGFSKFLQSHSRIIYVIIMFAVT